MAERTWPTKLSTRWTWRPEPWSPVTLQDADQGDTTTIIETAIAAAEQIEDAQAEMQTPQPLAEIIADKGYHSNQIMIELEAVGLRSYVAEPDRGRRDWSKEPAAQTLVYANRRRIRGARGRHLMRQRGERIERSFAHLYDTGGMRRTHLRGHTNILKRLLIHAGGFNLGLVMRHLIGSGTPRGLQDRPATVIAALLVFLGGSPTLAGRDFPHGTHSWPLCAGFRHLSPPPATPQPRPLSPRAVKHRLLNARRERQLRVTGASTNVGGYSTFRAVFRAHHESGSSMRRVSASAVSVVGCRPSTMDSTISGARKARRIKRPT
jgi:hypothetical protein